MPGAENRPANNRHLEPVIAAVSQTQGWILITIGLVIAVVVIARA